MTAAVPVEEDAATGPLYHSPWGLLDFQAEGVARWLLERGLLVTWDTGLGKGHLVMAGMAMLAEDGLLDVGLVCCETVKLDEWVEDFATFTQLEAILYHGDRKKRARLRQRVVDADHPVVLISTYETIKNDAVRFKKSKAKRPDPGPLLDTLGERRVAIAFDEIAAKLRSRTSGNYRAHAHLLRHIFANGGWAAGLTATPLEREPEDIFNQVRLVRPYDAPNVAEFESHYVRWRDAYGRGKYKNLAPPAVEPWVTPLVDVFAPAIHRKRKTDADVVDQFPEQVEEFTHVALGPRQREFVEVIADTFADDPDYERQVFQALRLAIDHPLALADSFGEIPGVIAHEIGVEGLAAIGSAKTERLCTYLDTVVRGQGAQVVVFDFYASVLRHLADALAEVDIDALIHSGRQNATERREALAAFKDGRVPVLLTSDAGARGINLPQASYALNYALPVTYGTYTQRINRIHRIGTGGLVTAQSFIAADTLEEDIASLVLRRNNYADLVLGDDAAEGGFVSAKDRRAMIARSRKRR